MATISESMRAAERLTELETLREEVTGGLLHAAPLLHAWAAAMITANPLRKRDGLRISPTVWRSWRFVPHSNGAYLDGTVGIVIERDGWERQAVGHAALRYSAVRTAEGVSCPPWEATDGTMRTFTTHTQGVSLPAAAHDIVRDHIEAAWGGLGVTVADVWAECFAYHLTSQVHDMARGKVYAHHVAREVRAYGLGVTV